MNNPVQGTDTASPRPGGPDEHVANIRVEHIAPVPKSLGNDDAIPSDADVPPALEDWLFGTEPARPCEHPIDPEAELQTYALLNPSQIFGLHEMISASGLQNACLFLSAAQSEYDAEEIDETAPILLRLERDASLLKSLMTGLDQLSDPPWEMWAHAPALYLRSRQNLPDLVRHFRRFTMAKDQAGRFVFHRFWDASCFEDFVTAHKTNAANVASLFTGISSFIVYTPHSCARLICDDTPTQGHIQISDQTRAHYKDLRRNRLENRITDHFLTLHEFEQADRRELAQKVHHYCAHAANLGVRDAADLFRFSLGLCLCEADSTRMTRLNTILTDTTLPIAARRQNVMSELEEVISTAKDDAHKRKAVAHG